jgi:transposase
MRGRTLQVAWQHAPEALFSAYRQATEPRVKTRRHALWLLRQGQTLGAVATVLGVGVRTLQRWVSWYQTEGLVGLAQHHPGQGEGAGAPAG